jgi:hypothetical protein
MNASTPESPGPFFDLLDTEDDEVMILSVLLDREEDGQLYLRHGSAVIAPPECGEGCVGRLGVAAGVQAERNMPRRGPSEIPPRGRRLGRRQNRSDLGRGTGLAHLPVAARAESTTEQRLPGANEFPEFMAPLSAPNSVIRIFPGTDNSASNFLASSVRPAQGTIWRSDERPELRIPLLLEHEGVNYGPDTQCLLGLHVPTDGSVLAAPPPGIFVGRLERRAWLGRMQGDGPQFQALIVVIGWSPSRFDLADLVVDLEQFIGGDLVNQLRMPLEDTDISARFGHPIASDATYITIPRTNGAIRSDGCGRTHDSSATTDCAPAGVITSFNPRMVACVRVLPRR